MPALPSKGNEVQIAVNVFDLDRVPDVMKHKLLSGRLDLSRRINTQTTRHEPDEAAIPFKCPLLEAAIIGDWLRSQDRQHGVFPTRLYINRKGVAWGRILSYVVLTEVDEETGKVKLNTDFFTYFKETAPLIAPKAKGPVKIGVQVNADDGIS